MYKSLALFLFFGWIAYCFLGQDVQAFAWGIAGLQVGTWATKLWYRKIV